MLPSNELILIAPGKKAELRNRGKDLNDELARATGSSSSKATSHRSGTGKPVYSSPAKNLRAAAAARAELSTLTGEAWRKQAERVNELVDVCNRQNEAYRKANPDAGVSRVVVSVKAVSQRSKGQASSPHVGVDRAQSVNSGKSKQLQTYDAEYAGKQLAAQGRGGQSKNSGGRGYPGAGRGNSAGRGQPPRPPGQQVIVRAQQQDGGQAG